jgi:hypothetical protein
MDGCGLRIGEALAVRDRSAKHLPAAPTRKPSTAPPLKAGLPPELPPASWNRARTALDNARTASRHSPVTKPRAELVLIPGRHRSRPIVRKR